jgi:adenylosuccinate lyase
MPLPARYADEVPELTRLWSPAGYFEAQVGIWLAECRAMFELHGDPTAEELEAIREALNLTADDLEYLIA